MIVISSGTALAQFYTVQYSVPNMYWGCDDGSLLCSPTAMSVGSFSAAC